MRIVCHLGCRELAEKKPEARHHEPKPHECKARPQPGQQRAFCRPAITRIFAAQSLIIDHADSSVTGCRNIPASLRQDRSVAPMHPEALQKTQVASIMRQKVLW